MSETARRELTMKTFVPEWCAHKGITQQELADRMGIGKSAMSKLFNGKQEWRLNMLSRAASALDLSIEDFFHPPIPGDVREELAAAARKIPEESLPAALKMLKALSHA